MKRKKNICNYCKCLYRIYDINSSRGKKYKRTVAWVCARSKSEREMKFKIKNKESIEKLVVPINCEMKMEYLVMEQNF